MKKGSRCVLLAVLTVVPVAATYAVSSSIVARRTISFVPSDVTSLLYTYLDACEKNPEDAITYTHFESANEKDAYSHSNIKMVDYELLGAEK